MTMANKKKGKARSAGVVEDKSVARSDMRGLQRASTRYLFYVNSKLRRKGSQCRLDRNSGSTLCDRLP